MNQGTCPICQGPTHKDGLSETYGDYSWVKDYEVCLEGYYYSAYRYGDYRVILGCREWRWDDDSGWALGPIQEVSKALEEARKAFLGQAPEKLAFRLALARDPYDRTTRSIYADWLEEQGLDDESQAQREWTEEKYDARKWLIGSSVSCNKTLDEILHAAHAYVLDEENWLTLPMNTPETAYQDMDRFWECFHTLMGKNLPDGQDRHFISCSC